MGVARSVASRYLNRGIEEDDLVQVAYAALTRAARDFDPSRHEDFLSYAVPTIRGELKKHFRDLGWTVRPPRRIQETQARITRAEGELVQLYGRSPRPSEIAEHLGIELDDVVDAMSADGCFSPSSLDRPLTTADGAGFATVADLLGEEDASQPAAEARVTLAPVVRKLKERDRRILYMRFFEERTQQEIADDIGVTQMQVSRLLSRIMRDLRTELHRGARAAYPDPDRLLGVPSERLRLEGAAYVVQPEAAVGAGRDPRQRHLLVVRVDPPVEPGQARDHLLEHREGEVLAGTAVPGVDGAASLGDEVRGGCAARACGTGSGRTSRRRASSPGRGWSRRRRARAGPRSAPGGRSRRTGTASGRRSPGRRGSAGGPPR